MNSPAKLALLLTSALAFLLPMAARALGLTLLVSCLLTPAQLSAEERRLSVAFDGTSIRKQSTVTPLFVAHSAAKDQSLVCSSWVTKKGVLVAPSTVHLIDHVDAARSLALKFSVSGDLKSISFADGSEIKFVSKRGSRVLVFLNPAGREIGRVADAQTSRQRVMTSSTQGALSFNPFRFGWKHLGITKKQMNEELAVIGVGPDVVTLIDTTLDALNEKLSITAVAATGGGVAAATEILEGWVSDGLGILGDNSKSRVVQFLRTAYDTYRIGRDLKSFFKEPSIAGIPGAVNGLEDLVDTIAINTDDLTLELHPSESQGSFVVDRVSDHDSYYLRVSSTTPNPVTVDIEGDNGVKTTFTGTSDFVTADVPKRTPGTRDTVVVTDKVTGEKNSLVFVNDTSGALVAVDLILETKMNQPISYGFPNSGAEFIQVVSPPSHGTLENVDLASGAFTYRPASGYIGTDTFQFVALRGTERSSRGTVTVTVKGDNTPPDEEQEKDFSVSGSGGVVGAPIGTHSAFGETFNLSLGTSVRVEFTYSAQTKTAQVTLTAGVKVNSDAPVQLTWKGSGTLSAGGIALELTRTDIPSRPKCSIAIVRDSSGRYVASPILNIYHRIYKNSTGEESIRTFTYTPESFLLQ